MPAPRQVLSHIDLLKGSSVLILGARDTYQATLLKKDGFEKITLLDKKDLVDGNPDNFEFIKINLQDYVSTEQYDLVLCRNVLQFTKDPLIQFERILSFGTTCYIELFGTEHEWKTGYSLVAKEDIDSLLANNPEIKIVYKEETIAYGKTYTPGLMAHHHTLTYVTTKKTS